MGRYVITSPSFIVIVIVIVCGLKIRFPLSFLVISTTATTWEVLELAVVGWAVVVTEYALGMISY